MDDESVPGDDDEPGDDDDEDDSDDDEDDSDDDSDGGDGFREGPKQLPAGTARALKGVQSHPKWALLPMLPEEEAVHEQPQA